MELSTYSNLDDFKKEFEKDFYNYYSQYYSNFQDYLEALKVVYLNLSKTQLENIKTINESQSPNIVELDNIEKKMISFNRELHKVYLDIYNEIDFELSKLNFQKEKSRSNNDFKFSLPEIIFFLNEIKFFELEFFQNKDEVFKKRILQLITQGDWADTQKYFNSLDPNSTGYSKQVTQKNKDKVLKFIRENKAD